MARKSRYIAYFKIITQNQTECEKVSCFDKSNKFFNYSFFLNVIILHLTNVQHVLDQVLTEKSAKSYLCSLTKLPKMVKTNIFLSLCISNLFMQCGDIDVDPGPKYSSLTFCDIHLRHFVINKRYMLFEIKEHISLIKRDDICTLDNCLVTEIRSQNEECFLTCLYRSPSQSHDEFEKFCIKFDILLSQINDELPICSDDFNARCSRWWRNDIRNFAGKEIDFLTSSAGYTQIIDKLTHVINKSSLCIDLIFCTNENVISKYGVDASLFDKCHHNVIYGKINIRVHSHQSLFVRFGTIVKHMLKKPY